jgi:hypothetical protein
MSIEGFELFGGRNNDKSELVQLLDGGGFSVENGLIDPSSIGQPL